MHVRDTQRESFFTEELCHLERNQETLLQINVKAFLARRLGR